MKTYRHATKTRSVEVAIWQNESQGGGTFYTATFKAQYKDGDEWKTAKGYGVGDLYQLIRCATDAAAFIFFETRRDEEKAAA